MRGTLPVGRVLGIPILLNISWFASFFLIVGLLALQVFPESFPGLGAPESWILAICGGLAFFVSIILHELGHCIVARHYGIPVRNITLFIFGGVSQITQEAPRAGAEFLMAFAGPAVSFVLGGMFVLIASLILKSEGPAAGLVWWLGGINLVLGVFNLLPGFPMDGGRLLRSTIWAISGNMRLATRLAALLGRGMAFALMGAGLITILAPPGWPLSADPLEGLWLIFIGLFLNRAAGQAQRQARILGLLRGYRAEQVMEPNVPTIAADTTLQSLLTALPPLLQDDVACFVERDGHVIGLIPRERLQRLPRDPWSNVTAAELMIPADQITPANPDDDGATLLQRMDAEGLPGLPVVSAGVVSGLVTRSRLFRALRSNPRLRLLRL